MPGLDHRVDLAVDRNGRREGASPDAAKGLDGEKPVVGSLPRLDAEELLELVEHRLGILDIASRPEAHPDDVFALRGQREEVIEGHDPVDLGEGNARFLAHEFLGLDGDIAVFPLDLLEDDHEGRGFLLVGGTDRHDVFLGFASKCHFGPPSKKIPIKIVVSVIFDYN